MEPSGAASTSEDLEAVRRYIQAIDFSRLKQNMRHPEREKFSPGWSQGKTDYVEQQYKNWFFLVRKFDGQGEMPPSPDIDEFWHQHILDTKAYQRDTEAVFGRFLHHWPYFGSGGQSGSEDDRGDLLAAWELVQQRYVAEYGELIYDYDEDDDDGDADSKDGDEPGEGNAR
jgi:hypothetical protein